MRFIITGLLLSIALSPGCVSSCPLAFSYSPALFNPCFFFLSTPASDYHEGNGVVFWGHAPSQKSALSSPGNPPTCFFFVTTFPPKIRRGSPFLDQSFFLPFFSSGSVSFLRLPFRCTLNFIVFQPQRLLPQFHVSTPLFLFWRFTPSRTFIGQSKTSLLPVSRPRVVPACLIGFRWGLYSYRGRSRRGFQFDPPPGPSAKHKNDVGKPPEAERRCTLPSRSSSLWSFSFFHTFAVGNVVEFPFDF